LTLLHEVSGSGITLDGAVIGRVPTAQRRSDPSL